jgi:hypothetical protein
MRRTAVTAIVLGMLVVACSTAANPPTPTLAPSATPIDTPTDNPPDQATDAPAGTPTATPPDATDAEPEPTPGANAPLWRTAIMRDVVSGAEFRIDDLRGQVVVIETMAIWCTSCRAQQREARTALASFDSSNVFYLSLDVDPNEREDELAAYSAQQEFDWHFAVASPDVSRSLAEQFGDRVLSPPSVPIIVLGPDGSLVTNHFGHLSADELAGLLQQAG